MKTLQVAVGVIKNAAGQVLISLRHPSLHQGGLWEFPGGKIESGESAEQALIRELKEELDLTVLTATPLITINHRYPDRAVTLHVFVVDQFLGQARHRHGQSFQWVELSELPRFPFPGANRAIINAARLPSYYAILDDADKTKALANLNKLLAKGIKLIQARLKSLPANGIEKLIAEAYSLCRQQGSVLLINSEMKLFDQFGSKILGKDDTTRGKITDGIHLTSKHLLSIENRPSQFQWVAASCHNLQELLHAQKIGADFAVLAPVLPTISHPDATPLGWEQFSRLVAKVNIPVYALGGMSEQCLDSAQSAGGQGIAGIRAFS